MSFTRSLLAAYQPGELPTRSWVRWLLPTVWLAFGSPILANKCVVLVLPPGGWADIGPRTLETLLSLAQEGAAGSLSCAVPRPMTEASAWVTLGAGNRAVWPSAPAAPTSLALRDSLGRAKFIAGLRAANAHLPYPVEVCSVGQTLRTAGYRTAIVGLSEVWQLAAVMDANGEVDSVATSTSPEALQRTIKQADYVVVIAGAAGDDAKIAKLVQTAARALTSQDLLIAVGLAPKEAPFVGLTPVVVRGPETMFSYSQLTSPTTRRCGIVANIDLAPTVLAHFRLSPPASFRNGGVIGLCGRVPLALNDAIALDVRGRRVHFLRGWLFPLWALLQVVLVPLAVVRRWPPDPSLRTAAMIALLFLPAASELTAVLPLAWPWPAWMAAILLGATLPAGTFLVCCTAAPKRALGYALAAAATTVAILIADQSAGAPLQPIVPIGYALGFGGRFYGIGNEAAGLLIAASILAAGLVLSLAGNIASWTLRARYLASVVLACIPILVIAWPTLGANAGCTLAAVVCAGSFLIARSRRRINRPATLLLGALALGVLILVAHMDAARPPDQITHIGRAWLRLTREGPPFLAELARRKATTAINNIHLVPALVPGALWALFWVYALLGPMRFVRKAYYAQPALEAPFKAIALAGLFAAFVNDSGMSIPIVMVDFALPVLGMPEVTGADE